VSAARATYLRDDCTASDFLERGYIVTSLAQKGILRRITDYSIACRLWSDLMASKPGAQFMDQVRVNDLARMAATLAFLAFPDLREAEAKHIPQAEIVIEPPTRLGRLA
jgi:methylase of polypeptide subunit release factors